MQVIYFHRSVLEMDLSFGFYGAGRRDCSRLVPEAGKKYAAGEFNHWASAGSFQSVEPSSRCCDDRNLILKTD